MKFFSSLDAKSNEIRQVGSNIDPNTHEHYLLDVDNPVVVPVKKKIRPPANSVWLGIAAYAGYV